MYRKDEEEWIEDNEIDPNAILIISSTDGNILYRKEIHNSDEIIIDISKFPEICSVMLEKRDIERYSISVNFSLDY